MGRKDVPDHSRHYDPSIDSHIPMGRPKRMGMTKVRVLRRAAVVGVTLIDCGIYLDYGGIRYYPPQYTKLYNSLVTRTSPSR